jgi:hypothetical protein
MPEAHFEAHAKRAVVEILIGIALDMRAIRTMAVGKD